jgi:hypothetical protein
VFHAGTASGDRGHVRFNSNNTLEAACYNGSWFVELKTNAVYRDPSAFYHIFVSIDTTNGTGKLFVNGEEPSLQTNTTTSSSTVLPFGKTIEHQIGQRGFNSTGYHDGLLADFYFIDGTALSTPVGNPIEDTGYSSYKPKAFDMSSYSGNSFHLKFEDNSDIGSDSTSNSNDFSVTNLSSHDVMLDTPTKNYAVLNPLQKAGSNGSDPTEGNLSLTGGSNPSKAFSSAIAVNSGKYYAEFHIEALGYPTVAVGDTSLWVDGYGSGRIQGNGVVAYDIRAASTTGQYFINSTSSSSDAGISPATDDIIQVAFDADTRKVWFGRNGTWNNSGDPANGTNEIGTANGTDALAVLLRSEVHSSAGTTVANFGQDPTFAGNKTSGQDTSQSEFYYAPPTGFKSLNTSNLADPTVTPEEHFNSLVYQGASPSDKAVTGVGFQPDLVWIKARTQTYNHAVYDSVRGATKELHPNTTDAEDTDSNGLKTFDSDGFTVGSDGEVGDPTGTRISWNWKAHQGGSTSYSNTLTLDVRDNYGYGSGWGTTKLEVWEGSTKLTDITNPPSPSSKIYNIKTNDLDKIKIVWYVDGSAGDWYNMYAVLKNSSNTTLASWDGNSWSGNSSDAPSDDDNFYLPSSFDSTNAATTGVVEAADADTEKYNSSAGFTIIKYAGDGSYDNDTKTLDHSLGVPLEFVIAKARTSNAGYDNGDWIVWHKDLSSSKYLFLNENYAQRTEASGYNLISTTNSGTQHQVVVNNGIDGSSWNYHYLNSGEDYILYGWAGVEGYSKFGTFEGNGLSDGPFIHTGFRPRFIMIKSIDDAYSWYIHDTARSPYNYSDNELVADTSGLEYSVSGAGGGERLDILSNGFKHRTSNSAMNQSNRTHIFAAFAESPFKYANAR